MLKYLIEKEFKQFRRNKFLPKLVIIMPCVLLLVLPWAADMEIKNINLTVVDNDHSPYSSRLIRKATSSGYFQLVHNSISYDQAMETIESGKADIIMEIPARFEKRIMGENNAEVLISANAVNGTRGGLGSVFLSSIVSEFSNDLRSETGLGSSSAKVEIIPQFKFNPKMSYKSFMIPALMVMLVTLICGFLPSLNIVGEKESGTIEQMNVTPVRKFDFIISKLIPYWIIGFVMLTLSMLLVWLMYGLIPTGPILAIYIGSVLYVIVISGFGIVISNNSGTMQQAMFVMFFFMIVFVLMSGLFTPISSMPGWAKAVTFANPLRYFIEIMRSVYLKGSGVADMIIQYAALVVFGIISNTWAVLSYRKTN